MVPKPFQKLFFHICFLSNRFAQTKIEVERAALENLLRILVGFAYINIANSNVNILPTLGNLYAHVYAHVGQ